MFHFENIRFFGMCTYIRVRNKLSREKLLDKLASVPTFGDQSSKHEIFVKTANSWDAFQLL